MKWLLVLNFIICCSLAKANDAAEDFGNDLPWPLHGKCALKISELSGLWETQNQPRSHFYAIRKLKEVQVNKNQEYVVHVMEYIDRQSPLFTAKAQVELNENGFWMHINPLPGKYKKGRYVMGLHSFKEPKSGLCKVHLVTIKNIDSKRWIRFKVKRIYKL